MKFICFVFFISFFLFSLKKIAKGQFTVSLERKFNQNEKFMAVNYSIKNRSTVLFESNEQGIHLIILNEDLKIFQKNVVKIENNFDCSKEIQKLLKIGKGKQVLIFSVDKWEKCLDLGLIDVLNLSSENFDLKLLIGGRMGLGHAFVYFSDGIQGFVKISHENNYFGEFLLDFGHLKKMSSKIDENSNFKQKLITKIGNNQYLNSSLGRFMENNGSQITNNSDFYNVTINAEIKLNFSTDQNISGSNTIQQKMNVNIPRNLSNIQNISNLTSLNLSERNNFSKNIYNSSDFKLSNEIKLNLNDKSSSLLKQRSQKPSKNGKLLNSSKNLEIEITSFGSQSSENDFASIKINKELIHASKSCGIHVVVIDPCKTKQEKNKDERENALKNLTKIYEELKFLYQKPLKNLEISCYDTFRSAKIGDYFIDDNNEETNIPDKVLITCPSLCGVDQQSKI